MIRKYKAFGLALVALCAFGAFAAQGAMAKPLTVEGITPPGKVFITGTQENEHVFTTSGGTVKCTTSAFSASQETGTGGVVNEMTVTPTYSGCTAFGFAGTDIKINECKYTFTTPTSIGVGIVTWGKEQFHITCPAGKTIEITPTTFGVSVCTQFVAAQTPTAGHIVGRNVAGTNPMHVTLETTLSEIHYTGTGGSCGNSETHSDAKYEGNITVKCYKNAAHTEQVGCTFS